MKLALLLFLVFFCHGLTTAQNVSRPATQTPADDAEDVVRITTNLVQLDAIVTDKKGQPITGLTAEDFELRQDGRLQKITNLSFVSIDGRGDRQEVEQKNRRVLAGPPVKLKREEVQRTVALVLDDLCLSFESMHYARKALRKFVTEDMQPGDLVAIVRTAGNIGLLQQFTGDKGQLLAAIEQIRWSPRPKCDRGEDLDELNENLRLPQSGLSGGRAELSKDSDWAEGIKAPESDVKNAAVTVGTLGALTHIVRGLNNLPGRKAVLFISDGFGVVDRADPGHTARILEAVRRVADVATRSSVTVYTLNARGLVTTNLTAADQVSATQISRAPRVMVARASIVNDRQAGLHYLAEQAGGFAIYNTNNLAKGITRVFDDQKSYYLIGYTPEASTFDPKAVDKFQKISLTVKRPGAVVRSRSGFYGVPDAAEAPASVRTAQQLALAVVSPFVTNEIGVRLTSLFINDAQTGSYLRSLLHINSEDLTFTQRPDGWQEAVIEVMALTFGENGVVVDQVSRRETVRARGETYQRIRRDGLVYFLNMPVKKPGAYQFRIAVRDAATQQIGSASQFVEIPNLRKDRLALSGLVISGERGTAQNATQITESQNDSQSSAAVRRFKSGAVINYLMTVYNAKLDKKTRQPKLDIQLRIFRDRELMFASPQQEVDLTGQHDPSRIVTGGNMLIGTALPPGNYFLQAVVTDRLSKKNASIATQWIDFEIIR